MEYRLLVVQHRSVNLSHMHFLAIKMHSSRYHTCLRKALHTIFIETVQLLLTIGFAPSLHTIYSTVLLTLGKVAVARLFVVVSQHFIRCQGLIMVV